MAVLEGLDEESSDIFCTNILDRYIARPDNLGEICLYEFAMWYQTAKVDCNNTDAQPSLLDEDELTNTIEKWFRLNEEKKETSCPTIS